VEDNPLDAELLAHTLSRDGLDFTWQRVETKQAYLAHLDPPPDIILADYYLPQFDAPEALRLLQEQGLDVPFIVVSGTIGEELAVACLRDGAADYLLKDRLGRLAEALRHALEAKRLRDERRREEEARRQAEETLRHSEAHFRALIEYSSDLVAILGSAGTIQYVSPSCQSILGYSAADLEGRDVFTLVHPDDLQVARQRLARLWQREDLDPLTARIRHANGSWRWLELVGHFYSDGLTLQGIIINARDISERVYAEQARQASEERYRQIVETAHEGIWLVDPEFRITFANARMAEMLGYAVEEILGASVYTFLDPDEHNQVERRAQRRRRGIREAVEVRYRRKDGTLLWVLASTSSFFDMNGHYAGALGMFMDITARKQAEEAVHRQLEHISALRTIDMAIISSLDVGLTLSVILEQTTRHLGVDAAIILTFNPHLHILEHAASHGFRGSATRGVRLRLGEGHAGRAALERRPLYVPDLVQEPPAQGDLIAGEGFVSCWAVPLITKGDLKGVLCLLHRDPLAPDQDWQDFLTTLAQQTAIAIDNASLFERLQRTTVDLVVAYDSTIEGWSRALDLRDRETEGHSQRVTEMTLVLARALGLSDEFLVHVRRGALLHDIGKMGIPDAILLKPGPLTEEEWAIMRQHPTLAYQLLLPIIYLRPALDIPYRHHEKWDGSGYPHGLRGAQIPLAARAFAVVDVWDALTSDRPYRPAWSRDRVLAYIREQSGYHFDPAVVDAFLALQMFQ
jgi:PAS domain S-box-containing protein